MSPRNFDAQIRHKIETFVEELSALVRAAAVQSVTEAFGGAAPAPGGRRPRAAAARVASRAKGKKRTAEELESLTEKLLAAVKATPGLRMEQIAEKLETTTQELALPARKLTAEKKIRTKGERRATKYFPAG